MTRTRLSIKNANPSIYGYGSLEQLLADDSRFYMNDIEDKKLIREYLTETNPLIKEEIKSKLAARFPKDHWILYVDADGEEQINSFTSQMKYYKEKIESNPDWILVNVYADEAITGTKVELRDGFKSMINDAMNNKIDIIMTKSISRFARNTVDTLNYVRKLKENNVAVFFEEENINTLTMDGELLLTILSSVAQQEVQNIS